MMNSPADFTGPVNLGNPTEITMIELAEAVLELTGSTSDLIFKPLPQDDPKQRRPNIELAKQHLDNWQPEVYWKDGLKRTITYFDNILAAKGAKEVTVDL